MSFQSYLIHAVKKNKDDGRILGFMTNLGFHTIEKVVHNLDNQLASYELYYDGHAHGIGTVNDRWFDGDKNEFKYGLFITTEDDRFIDVNDVLPARDVF